MSRNFENWIDAYLDYASDGFTPPQFNLWSGLSCIAASLERKVWLPWSDTFQYYPNIFVLMVSLPGAGKSTALNKAMGIIYDMNTKNGNTLNLIPSQVTEAKFIELMGHGVPFAVGTAQHFQSSGFYWASEASNSLKNVYGDFISCLTDFYDCPPFWEKATIKDDKLTLRNVCLNLLAGSTFDYLSKLVTDDNIMGGFASRLIYVQHKEKLVRNQKFQLGGTAGDESGARNEYRKALVEDLQSIHKLVGPMRPNREFGAAWEAWYPEFERKRQDNPSEKMQSLLVRTNTNVLKTSMLFSAACSDSKEMTIDHWERALEIIEPITEQIPGIFRQSKALDTRSQEGINQAVFREFEKTPTMSLCDLSMRLVQAGFTPQMSDSKIKHLRETNQLRTVSANAAGPVVQLLTNANDNI